MNMEIIDLIASLLSSPVSFKETFQKILGIKQYMLAKNHDGDILCLLYGNDPFKIIAVEYLKEKGFDTDSVVFEYIPVNTEQKKLDEILKYKIVVLDGKLALYSDVEKKSLKYNIDGFDGSLPKHGLNEYNTISECV